MESLISEEARVILMKANADAALDVDPPRQSVEANLGELTVRSSESRRPSAAALLQLANMIVSATPRERCISFVR